MTILCMPLHAQNVPNAVEFLPEPPSNSSIQYVNDMIQYYWGKSIRTTERGQEAAAYTPIQMSTYMDAFSSVLGFDISEKNTPAIYNLFDVGMRIGEMAAEIPQNYYRRTRPYSRFEEHTPIPADENKYSTVGCYPSVPSMLGWLYALMLTEVCPSIQDKVLTQGYNLGLSPVITGYNWNSDTHPGRLLASAILSRLHSQSSFNAWVTDAKNEYEKKVNGFYYSRADEDSTTTDEPDEPTIYPYISLEDVPDATKFLPGPPDSTSMQFGYDIIQHMEGKDLRNTSTGATAREDVTYDVDNFCKVFSPYLGITLSASNTPQIYELMTRVHPLGNGATQGAKSLYMRKRPYVQMIEASGYAADEEDLRYTGSYPSGHASGSWLMALVLSEIAPDAQEEILARAYQYGQGRVITGYHWQTDVDDGRVLATGVYACLHTSSEFQAQMLRAKDEFRDKTTGVRAASADTSTKSEAPVYTIGGIRLEGQPARHGIYIQGDQKVAY